MVKTKTGIRARKPAEYNGVIANVEFKTAKAKAIHAVFLIIMLIISLICVVPILWMLISAFKDTKEFLQIPPSFFPEHFDIGKLGRVWKDYNFLMLFGNTIYMAAGDIVFTIVVNGLAGYVLSRLKPRGSRLIFMLIVWTMLLPNNVSQVPLFMTFTDFPVIHANLSNTYWAMWLSAGANCYYILLFKSFFDSLSISYFEAAKVDGCSNIGMFFRIVIPLSLPIIAVIIIFQFNTAWGSFFWPYLLINDPDRVVLGQKLFSMKSNTPIDEYLCAMIFVIIPPAILYAIFQKQIMGGINIGGVKG